MRTQLRTLIVEDSEDDARLLVRELTRGGYDVTATRVDTPEGLGAQLEAGPWDVVFADFTMPGFRGTGALAMVRERDVELPFIFVSGTIGEDVAVEAMRAGAHDYVMKGHLKRLVPAVERELREAAGRRARHRMEGELRAAQERHRVLFEHIADAVFVLDAAGTVSFASPSVGPIFGLAPADLVGRPLRAFVHPDDAEATAAAYQGVATEPRGVRTVEIRLRRADGEWRMTEAVLRNLLNHADVRGLVVTARDITERKRLEAEFLQAQKLESVGRLAGGVAHDFNNMLTAVLGYADLLIGDETLRDAQRADVLEIKRSAKRATMLTRQLLAFSRRQVISPRPLDLNDVVADMERMLRRLLREDIEFTTSLAPDLPAVRADAGQVEQVIVNLVVNARDAMPDGGRLTIETRPFELDPLYAEAEAEAGVAPGPYVLLVVNDTGTGMDAATRLQIFEPFFTTKGPGEGTGLGLATVYGIVKQSGGHIWVYSELGSGTTFKICLPRAGEEATGVPAPEATTDVIGGSEAVLVVEDESTVRDLAARVLRERGYTVYTAAAADEALEWLRTAEHGVELLITDVVLPGMSGTGLAEEVKRLRPELPVLFMSGYAHSTLARQGVLDPEVLLIEKPFAGATLSRKVRQALDGRH